MVEENFGDKEGKGRKGYGEKEWNEWIKLRAT